MTRIVHNGIALSSLALRIGGAVIGSDVTVSAVCNDSREIQSGDLFIACEGSSVDGEKYTAEAFKKGASAAVVRTEGLLSGKSGIVVADPASVASSLASEFLGNPSHDLSVIGVTGTNGKTTTTWIMQAALEAEGIPTLRIGTLGAFLSLHIDEEFGLTTPDPLLLQNLIFKAKSKGAKAVVMEVSSHGLQQGRVHGIEFDGVGFTNISRDHLDYHQTMERYVSAKAEIFKLLESSSKPKKSAVMWCEDEWTKTLASTLAPKSYSLKTLNLGCITGVSSSLLEGTSFAVDGVSVNVPFIGDHNVENSSIALILLLSLGHIKSPSKFALIPPVPGRLEPVGPYKNFFVDYAHTPDALERALISLRPYCKGKLWVLFGCGGDRDKGKRPVMGEIACRLADEVVLTSDNPRTEDPQSIVEDARKGCSGKNIHVEVDRSKALHFLAKHVAPEDVALVAGKGHENYQIIGKTKIHFSDQEILKEAL